ncbi:MAG: hypothetical protein Q4C83_01605 [Candidatus Saccharibacteria bacterium]|nr:hypothetical protein [Candidatus Saccharibacteria bacterium]
MTEGYKAVIDLYDTYKEDEKTFMSKLIPTIGLNDYDKDNSILTTILDFAVEYADDATEPEQRKRLAAAAVAVINVLRNDCSA